MFEFLVSRASESNWNSIPSTLKGKSKAAAIKPSVLSPQYQNSVLEENIADNRYYPKLYLRSMDLTDQDVRIVAQGMQYLSEQLKYNKVRK
jgi:hypothetical protein